jgi:hypothetical protein
MKRKCLAVGISTIAVILLILASLTNVIGYQTVQSSNQNTINNEISQKELLFQTIVDIANNRDIQKIILKYQISSGNFFNPDVKFSLFNTPVLTKNQLKHMYFMGLLLSKIISKSRMHSMVEQYQLINQGMQKEITTVIEKDATLNGEMTQLSNLKCDCENENTTQWSFPVICFIAESIYVFFVLLTDNINIFGPIALTILTIILGVDLFVFIGFNCIGGYP